ncbi:MAG TPA: hypothetical protein VG860_17300 [Terriglobia bacterium]|jgi:hypothetical protein|nr:hypothetical protein [Terriglobia bacterium]
MKRSGKPHPDPSLTLAHQPAFLSPPQHEPDPKPGRSLLSAYLAEIGRKGGLKGGKARAAKLSAKRRRRIAIKAAQSRWSASPKFQP